MLNNLVFKSKNNNHSSTNILKITQKSTKAGNKQKTVLIYFTICLVTNLTTKQLNNQIIFQSFILTIQFIEGKLKK